jgi:hypothetical protein
MIHQRVVPDRFRTPQWQALAVVTIAFAVEKLFRAPAKGKPTSEQKYVKRNCLQI